jgi:AhpD family alkylhydroperoxidase
MSFPHLHPLPEDEAPAEVAALYARAHQKFGPTPLPRPLRALGNSPALFRDALLNLERVIGEKGEAPRSERLTIAVGVAVSLGAPSMSRWLDALAEGAGVLPVHRKAAAEVAIACRTYNAYFRARSMMEAGPLHEFQVQLRATPLVQSALDRRVSETLCIAVSVANGCKTCTAGHIATALSAGATHGHVDDVIRLGAVLTGLAPFDEP